MTRAVLWRCYDSIVCIALLPLMAFALVVAWIDVGMPLPSAEFALWIRETLFSGICMVMLAGMLVGISECAAFSRDVWCRFRHDALIPPFVVNGPLAVARIAAFVVAFLALQISRDFFLQLPKVSFTISGPVGTFEGEIGTGLGNKLSPFFDVDGPITLVLRSGGGSFEDASEIAEMIRQHGRVTTLIDGSCESACATIFAAGAQRCVLPGSVLGLHRGRKGTEAISEEGQTAYVESIVVAGVDRQWVMNASKSRQMYRAGPDELRRAGLVNCTQ